MKTPFHTTTFVDLNGQEDWSFNEQDPSASSTSQAVPVNEISAKRGAQVRNEHASESLPADYDDFLTLLGIEHPSNAPEQT